MCVPGPVLRRQEGAASELATRAAVASSSVGLRRGPSALWGRRTPNNLGKIGLPRLRSAVSRRVLNAGTFDLVDYPKQLFERRVYRLPVPFFDANPRRLVGVGGYLYPGESIGYRISRDRRAADGQVGIEAVYPLVEGFRFYDGRFEVRSGCSPMPSPLLLPQKAQFVLNTPAATFAYRFPLAGTIFLETARKGHRPDGPFSTTFRPHPGDSPSGVKASAIPPMAALEQEDGRSRFAPPPKPPLPV